MLSQQFLASLKLLEFAIMDAIEEKENELKREKSGPEPASNIVKDWVIPLL